MTTEPKPIPPIPEPPVIHVDLRFDPGCTALGEDLDRLNDRIINLLDHEFPEHSGLGMLVELTGEDEDLASRLEAAQASIKNLKGAMMADDDRLTAAGNRVGLYFGCDTPDMMADEIESLRDRLSASKALAGELAEALEKLKPFVRHERGCRVDWAARLDHPLCTCGLCAAIAKFRSTQPQA